MEFTRYDGYVMIQKVDLILLTVDPSIITNLDMSRFDRSIINMHVRGSKWFDEHGQDISDVLSCQVEIEVTGHTTSL